MLSTRVRATGASFVNTYEWGSVTGDPHRVARWSYDAFRYLANWGTHELIPRLIGSAEFTGRVEAPRGEHRRESVLIGQLAAAGL